jgi:short-chain fatty acids transporter
LNPAARLADVFTDLTQKYVPDPFVLCLGLTALVAVLALAIERKSPLDLVTAWGDGFWSLLSFTMQMAFVLAAGYVLAHTPFVDRMLDRVADQLPSPRMAVAAATLIGGAGSYLNWGFGLVIGGVVARKFALRVPGVHYPLIIAAAYSGFTLYGFGLSASIPITISTPGHPLEDQMGVVALTQTIWSLPMVVTALLTLALLLVVNPLLHPSDPASLIEINRSEHDMTTPASATAPAAAAEGRPTIAERVNGSRSLSIGASLVGILYLVLHFVDGGTLDINAVNFTLLFVGILLMRTPGAYVSMISDAVKTVSGILLQYPFYAGIMAIMAASGLVVRFGHFFADVATPGTLPLLGLVSSFFINFFAPSAGGHWVIQGPFMIEAAASLNSSLAQNAMAVQLGNAWNDIIQPLWILPVLALSKLRLKDIMGYLVISMLAVGVLYVVAVLVWGLLGH